MDDTSVVVRVSGWRALLVVLIAGAVAVALVLALLWMAALLAVLGLVLWLNMGIIPRLASRLRVSRWVLDLLVLVALCATGWLVNSATGATAGAAIWLFGIGVPRAFGVLLQRRVRAAAAPSGLIIEGVAREVRDDPQEPVRLPEP
jgi:hypothetical protein